MTEKQLNDLDKAAILIAELDEIFGEVPYRLRGGIGKLIWQLQLEQMRIVNELNNSERSGEDF